MVRLRIVTAALVLTSLAAAGPEPGAAAPAAQAPGERRALLVGVTRLLDPALSRFNLDGPANDVDLFRRVLQQAPFSVPAANIRTLAGLPDDVTRRPTRANIEREFRALRDAARPGDQIVVLMAGHGSQQPANRDSGDVEPDGLDEIFIPADAGAWDRTDRRVVNAVVDDDIRRWVTDIRGRGASVWIIFDSCHSGTMTRGAPAAFERDRQIPIGELVPRDEIARAAAGATASRGSDATDARLGLGASSGEIAALFASNMVEVTTERPLPDDSGPVHGLFSYTIASLLSQSTSAMTYRELVLRVTERYRALGRTAPTPIFEGGGLDREILGVRTWPDRPQLLLGGPAAAGGWQLEAGSVHGLTAGSILEVFPPAGSAGADVTMGSVKVLAVTPTSARVSPVAFENLAAAPAARLVPGSRARVKHYDFGDLRLKVALQNRGAGSDVVVVPAGRGPQGVEQAMARLAQTSNGLAMRVDSPAADVFGFVDAGRLRLLPGSGWPSGVGAAAIERPTVFDVGAIGDPLLPEQLGGALRKIARAWNLMRLATTNSPLPLTLQVSRFAQSAGGTGRPLFATPDDIVVRKDEHLEFRVTNRSPVPIDVTLLYIDANYGITAWFPNANQFGDMKILPGQDRVVGARGEVITPFGWESTVAIAVESSLMPQDFTVLAQEGLTEVRGGQTRGEARSPLWQLLCEASACQSGTRGIAPAGSLGQFGVKLVTWRTVEK
jgi:hypothetical protein